MIRKYNEVIRCCACKLIGQTCQVTDSICLKKHDEEDGLTWNTRTF
ncbi:MAG TPA: hypothetical protein VK861_03300 [Bacteroidales bacterium]|nr:hypothetical protein [Bacteroidales bacterium]